MSSISDVFRLGRNIILFPVVHGSGDCAVEVRRLMLNERFSCLAVPLPPSFQQDVETALEYLPAVTAVFQREPQKSFSSASTDFETGEEQDSDTLQRTSYVPIDPCQPVIAALRIARQERMTRAFIDVETDHYLAYEAMLPDPWALKRVPPEQFATAILPALPAPKDPEHLRRIHWMANQLHRLSAAHASVLCLCGLPDWPWIRDAFNSVVDCPLPATLEPAPTELYGVAQKTLLFMLGEMPYITGLYERTEPSSTTTRISLSMASSRF